MPIQFTHPGYLLLLLPLLAFAWWAGRESLANLGPTRRRLANGVRLAVLLLLVLALSGLQVVHVRHALATVFVLDVSHSVPAELQQAALRYLQQACREMRQGDTAALVVFGADAYVELPPEAAPRISRIYSRPSRDYSDLASALRLALASFPQGTGRQVVVLSDGNENVGSTLDQALLCQSLGVRVHTVGLRSRIRSEALLERATLPPEVKQGEPFEIKLVASATVPASGRVRLFRNGAYLGEQPVRLPPGKSVITLSQSIVQPGFYTYQALLEAGPDTLTENNRALGFVQVRGKPQVLLLAGFPEQARPLARALQGHDMEVSLQGPAGIPTSLAGWRNWDAVVLSDIPAYGMAPEQMLMIQSYVRDLGGGFAMLGGEDGFGAGGYYRTPVEATLPVDMSVRKQKVFPTLAVLLIMDTSGSSGMPIDGKTMIRLEAESAIQVIQLLQPIDRLGVVISGEAVDVISPIRPASSSAAIIRDLSRMRPGGGGIFCRPSMALAYEMMRGVNSRIRHVIMLADGGDCDEQEGCAALALAMRREKMTFSTVSFGLGPHSQFLATMARLGGGKFYVATRAHDLPRIFTKDAMLASKSLLIEQRFRPKVDPQAEILRGLNAADFPPLLGYVATSPKPLASLPLQTHKDDPLLATWRYGLGRSVAFTSDAQAHWAAHWLGWPGYGKFWSQAVRWMVKRSGAAHLNVVVEEQQGVGKISVEAIDSQGNFLNFLDLQAHLVTPDLRAQKLHLEQTAPGRYRREFPVRAVGAYLVTVSQSGKQGGTSRTAGVVVPYPPEYRDLEPNEFLLTQLAQTTGGRREPAPDSIYGGKREAARQPQDIWTYLVLLAALLWPVDVAVRRLAIEPAQVQAALAWTAARWLALRHLWRLPQARRGHEPTLGRLLETKQRASQRQEPEAPWVPPPAEPAPPRPAPRAPDRAPAPPAAEQPQDALSRLKAAKRRARQREEEPPS